MRSRVLPVVLSVLSLCLGTLLVLAQSQTSGPAVSFDPPSLDFGGQAVGAISDPKTITLTNSGTDPLDITSITLTGPDPSEFVLIGGSDPGTLQPGESRTITVAFQP